MNNFAKGIWRLFQPLRIYGLKYPIGLWKAYFKFFNDWRSYIAAGGKVRFRYIAPILKFEGEDNQTGGGHYFYQDIWALRILNKIKPIVHFDIGSRYDGFVGQATAITKVIAIDIREPNFKLPDFEFKKGDITFLPLLSNSIDSISCLHTIEHIGLGRYGDSINPSGVEHALLELQRVLKESGHLIISFPIGKPRTEFNAQRIINPISPLKILNEMVLTDFSIITDEDVFIENTDPGKYLECKYSCGLYYFVKKHKV